MNDENVYEMLVWYDSETHTHFCCKKSWAKSRTWRERTRGTDLVAKSKRSEREGRCSSQIKSWNVSRLLGRSFFPYTISSLCIFFWRGRESVLTRETIVEERTLRNLSSLRDGFLTERFWLNFGHCILVVTFWHIVTFLYRFILSFLEKWEARQKWATGYPTEDEWE